jgi:hypothetical protein
MSKTIDQIPVSDLHGGERRHRLDELTYVRPSTKWNAKAQHEKAA